MDKDNINNIDYKKLTLPQLKELLETIGLDSTGRKKADLIQRLTEHDELIKSRKHKHNLTVKTLSGGCYTFYLESNQTLLDLKNEIHNSIGAPPNKIKLYHICYERIGKVLDDNTSLLDLGLGKESFFNMYTK